MARKAAHGLPAPDTPGTKKTVETLARAGNSWPGRGLRFERARKTDPKPTRNRPKPTPFTVEAARFCLKKRQNEAQFVKERSPSM
jgi:hypothetical protein